MILFRNYENYYLSECMRVATIRYYGTATIESLYLDSLWQCMVGGKLQCSDSSKSEMRMSGLSAYWLRSGVFL